jgi:hypothetical protein
MWGRSTSKPIDVPCAESVVPKAIAGQVTSPLLGAETALWSIAKAFSVIESPLDMIRLDIFRHESGSHSPSLPSASSPSARP